MEKCYLALGFISRIVRYRMEGQKDYGYGGGPQRKTFRTLTSQKQADVL